MFRPAALACLALAATLGPALAQNVPAQIVPVPRLPGEVAPPPEPRRIPSHCIALAQGPTARLHRAAFGDALAQDSIRLHYIGHASFALETAGGLTAVTDYTGFTGTRDFIPDVVTMNNAHSTHYTSRPDPRIPHVLPGWGKVASPASTNWNWAKCWCAMCQPMCAAWGASAPMAIRSSFSRWQAFASAIWGICITNRGRKITPCSGVWMW